jgi:hypothetical protein
MELETFKRTEISQEFTGILNEMLKGSKHDKSTQVMEHELQWDSSNASSPLRFQNLNLGAENFLEIGIKIDDKNVESEILSQGDHLIHANLTKPKVVGDGEVKVEPLETSLKGSKSGDGLVDRKEKAFQLEYGLLKNFMWSIPCTLSVFLKNTIAQKDAAKVLPWHILRKEIDSFYQYIANASKNMTARVAVTTSFEEYLCMYLLDVVEFHLRSIR